MGVEKSRSRNLRDVVVQFVYFTAHLKSVLSLGQVNSGYSFPA